MHMPDIVINKIDYLGIRLFDYLLNDYKQIAK